MPQPRRRFLQQLGLASAATVLLSGKAQAWIPAAIAPAIAPPSDPGSHSAFAPYLGHEFMVKTAAASPVSLRLVEIARHANHHPDPATAREHCFTLVFDAAPTAQLPEGIHTLSAPGRAPFDVFVSPIGGGNGRSYQAVFNRI